MGSFDCTNDGVCVVRRKCRNNQNFFPTTASRKLKYMRLLCSLSRVSRLKKLFFGEGKRGKLLDIQHNPKMINCFRLIFIPSTSFLLCICFVQWVLFSTPVWLFMERFVLFLWLLPVESFQSFIIYMMGKSKEKSSKLLMNIFCDTLTLIDETAAAELWKSHHKSPHISGIL